MQSKEAYALEVLASHLSTSGDRIVALVLEPLIQGANGMKMCRPAFVEQIVHLVQNYEILVIFDEVMTGFGRTGTYFCFEQINIIPDFLCLAKGLTGGFLPLALTITTEKVYKAFWDEPLNKSFAHGHSYTANPLGCAAAIASLDLLMQPSTMQSIQAIHHTHTKEIVNLPAKHKRITGTIAAFDVGNAQTFKRKCLEQGLLIRPLGNAVYLLPPYSTTVSELEEAYEKIKNIL